MNRLGTNRVQVSLVFRDDDVYRLVQQYKQNRALNDLIIQCLTTYCNNAEVRRIIANEAQQGYEEVVGRSVSESQEICDNIRNALAMQSYYASELKQTLADGADEITDILDASNGMAKDSGVAKSHQSEFGSTMYKLELHSDFVKDAVERAVSGKNGNVDINNSTLGVLFKRLFSNMHDDEGVRMVDQLFGGAEGLRSSGSYSEDEGVSTDSHATGMGSRGESRSTVSYASDAVEESRSFGHTSYVKEERVTGDTNVVKFEQGSRAEESRGNAVLHKESIQTPQSGVHQGGDGGRYNQRPVAEVVHTKEPDSTGHMDQETGVNSSHSFGDDSATGLHEEGSLGTQASANTVEEDASADITDLMSSIF